MTRRSDYRWFGFFQYIQSLTFELFLLLKNCIKICIIFSNIESFIRTVERNTLCFILSTYFHSEIQLLENDEFFRSFNEIYLTFFPVSEKRNADSRNHESFNLPELSWGKWSSLIQCLEPFRNDRNMWCLWRSKKIILYGYRLCIKESCTILSQKDCFRVDRSSTFVLTLAGLWPRCGGKKL